MDDFVIKAVLAGFGVVMITGPYGCFVVWRRMAYFGDTLAHAALLGIAFALLLDLDAVTGVVSISIFIALSLAWMQRRRDLSSDTLLGILSHSSLAAGLVVISLLHYSGNRVDLMSYLFGDILAVTNRELLTLFICVAIVLLVLKVIWRQLLSMTIHEELAMSEGVAVERVRLLFMLMLALVIAVSMKLVGILLITAMLIIPAASARRFSHSPLQMIILSVVFGFVSVMLGMWMSLLWDTPTGPSMVVIAALLFLLTRTSPSVAFNR